MRLSIVFLVSISLILVAMDANAQRRRRPRDRDGQDQEGNGGFPGGGPSGGFPGGGFPGAGGPGGGFPGGGYPGGGFPGGGPGGNFNDNGARLAGMLQQLDSNRNGQLDAGEVRALGQRAFMVEAMIRRAGMEPKYPIKIAALQEAIRNARNNRNGFPGGPPMGNPNSPPGQDSAPAGDDKATAQTPMLVPGFGVNTPMQPIPGFDGGAKPTVAVAAAAAPATSAAPAKADGAPPASPQDQIDARTRGFAESILKQNDKDGSKTLERDKVEWAELRDAEAIDTDHNGIITLDELTVYYQAKNGVRPKRGPNPGKREAPATDPPPNANAAPTPTTATSTGRGKPYRMLPAIDRLPDGLPDWFARKDVNGDGQVTMSEYSSEWSAEKAREFTRYDLNGDGIVTPQECLQVEKKK